MMKPTPDGAFIPTTARAAVFRGAGIPLAMEAMPVPELGERETLVRVRRATLCGSDLHTFYGRRSSPTPVILGHEIVGSIAAFSSTGERVDVTGTPLNIGDRITWSIAASCGECFYCQNELPQKCEQLLKYGHEAITPARPLFGGLAECCVLAAGTTIVRLPDELSDCVACPANCATATVAAALRAAGDCRDKSVLIQGAGMLGLTACAMARHLGAREVIACDVDPDRLKRAIEFGATHTLLVDDSLQANVLQATTGRGADLALELSGSVGAMQTGLDLLRIGGCYVLVGAVFPTASLSIEPQQIVRRMLTIKGVHNYAPQDLIAAVEFLVETRAQYPWESLTSHEVPLLEAERAFELAAANPGTRIALVP